MKEYKTEQEKFWAGHFGNEYIERNNNKALVASKIAILSKIISVSNKINSCIEFGANIGLNLKALKNLLPNCKLSAVEINKLAASKCALNTDVEVYNESILEFNSNKKWNLTFTMGVLIHIAPEELTQVYKQLYKYSDKYILICEYYNPVPVSMEYRGNKEKLYKRDFAGEFLDIYHDTELVNYGFWYHRDNNFPSDDMTWFLIKKC